MRLNRRQFLVAAAAVPVAARARDPQAGTDYNVLKVPQPVESGDRVEVVDFFQYSCPHCFHFLPELSAWKKRLAPDVSYRFLPVVFDERTTPHAKILYSLEALKRIDDLHAKVFNMIQVQRKPLLDTNDIADFMAGEGIDRAQWLAMFNSFAIATKVSRAGQVWRAYEVDGTPSLGCDGKFVTSPAIVHSEVGSLQVMDYLVERARRERARKS
ncbi:MAG TPA: thiol:disulfide interchange protein DsbA/DsbL [Burkholderiaceae bacterium]|nr:thiol:disulfide interchange protein DsbA/DsbL [Burkholderiaceae bacterium]